MKGQYIVAAATMKKDFEIMVRLAEISLGRDKEGKTPNPQNAPQELRFIYGQLNNVAHISRKHLVSFYSTTEEQRSEGGISVNPQFKKEQFLAFYGYHIALIQTIVAEALKLYDEMYGKDKEYIQAFKYFIVLTRVVEDEGEKIIARSK